MVRGVSERIEFRGFIEEERLPRAYGDADLFVMPSHGEGFGIVFLEALACGVPAVGGSRDGSADALDEGRLGKLVDPDDSAGLIAAIVESLAAGRRAAGPRRAAMLAAYGFDVFRARVASALGGPPVPRRA
jgi:glycosyltransferase involved in cell wall biosynthesis